MFIAIVLICQAGVAELNNCFVSMAPYIFPTEEQCIDSIALAAASGKFTAMPENPTAQPFYPTDYVCYNWLEEKPNPS